MCTVDCPKPDGYYTYKIKESALRGEALTKYEGGGGGGGGHGHKISGNKLFFLKLT